MQSQQSQQNKAIQTAKTIDINNIAITAPKSDPKTKRISSAILNTSTKSGIFLQSPFLISPFGVSSYEGSNGKNVQEETKTWSLVLKAAGGQNEDTEEISLFITFLKALDELGIDHTIQHSNAVYKKTYKAEQRAVVSDILFSKGVKPSVGSDGTQYPDKITLKIMKNDKNLPDVLVFKNSPEPIEITSWETLQALIPKGMPIKAIIQPRIYYINNKAGINYRVLQIKLPNFEKVGRPVSYAFTDIPVIEDDTTKQQVVDNNNTKKVKDSQQAEDSEDSEVEVESN